MLLKCGRWLRRSMPKTKFPAFPTAIDTDWRLLSQNLGLQALLVVKAVFAVFRPQADSLAKSKSEGKQVKNKRSIEGAGIWIFCVYYGQP